LPIGELADLDHQSFGVKNPSLLLPLGQEIAKKTLKKGVWVPQAYGPWDWEASFTSCWLIFGGEEISIPETRPIWKSYIAEYPGFIKAFSCLLSFFPYLGMQFRIWHLTNIDLQYSKN
jgi:hypothetical protein